jgi:hypothetical protein
MAAPQRTLPGRSDTVTAISTPAMRQISVDRAKYRAAAAHHFGTLGWIWRFVSPHIETDGNPDFAGFCPFLTSHSESPPCQWLGATRSSLEVQA